MEVLHGISLSAEAGTVTALLGRSGCGKTTLLNLAGAMDFPHRGRSADRRTRHRAPCRTAN